MTCFKCNGSKKNKKGGPCKKCGGSGIYAMKGLNQIVKFVKEEVGNFCNSTFKGLFSEYLSVKGAS